MTMLEKKLAIFQSAQRSVLVQTADMKQQERDYQEMSWEDLTVFVLVCAAWMVQHGFVYSCCLAECHITPVVST